MDQVAPPLIMFAMGSEHRIRKRHDGVIQAVYQALCGHGPWLHGLQRHHRTAFRTTNGAMGVASTANGSPLPVERMDQPIIGRKGTGWHASSWTMPLIRSSAGRGAPSQSRRLFDHHAGRTRSSL
jgi:hypothetical protein